MGRLSARTGLKARNQGRPHHPNCGSPSFR
jgi:hypothetical protein